MRKFNYMIIFITLLIAMMSVTVAADVNDSTEQVTTSVTQDTTSHTDIQVATNDNSNEITKKTENNIKESALNTPKTVTVDSTNYDKVFLNDTLNCTINDGDTIDVQEDIIDTNLNITINKAINLTTTTGATIYLNTTGGNLLGTNPGNSFKIVNSGSYTNVTNLNFYNTQVFVINAHHVTMDNINVTVEDRTVGSGVGVTSIRDNSTYVTVKNSNFYTKNNGGSSSVVLAWADYCTIDNNNITGEGNVGNLMYLTTYNINGTPEYSVDINMYNNITNNNIKAVSVTGPCIGVVVTGHDNKFENNNVQVSSSFAGQWMSPTMNEQGDHDDRWEGNNYINNDVYGSFTGTKNSTITGNTFHSSVSLPERCIFKNNNAENSTVRVTGPNCDLCNNTIYTLVISSSPTYVCYDNTFTNDPDSEDPRIIWYNHGTRGNSLATSNNVLNKKISSSVKTEGETEEPTIVDIVDDETFLKWFKVNTSGAASPISTNITGDTVYNFYSVPDNVINFNFRITGKDATRCRDFHYSLIGKSLNGENNIVLKKITIGMLHVYVSNITIVNENDDTATSTSTLILLSGALGATDSNVTLDNIKLNATIEPNTYQNLIVSMNYYGATIQNSEFNVKAPSIENTLYVMKIRSEATKLINNTINVEETMSVGENPSIVAIQTIKEYDTDNPNNLTCNYNNITLIGEPESESTLYGIKLDSDNNTITNNNITVTSTKATGVELTGNTNTVTDNYIVANDIKGDSAVTDNGENNIVENNAPIDTSLKVIAPATANINEATPITILLKDSTGKLIPEQEIKVTVGDNQTETVTTDEDGIAVYNLTATASGELNLTITYEAQGAYTQSNTTVTINVNEDKDAIIEQLNDTVNEQEKTINTLNETVNNQTALIDELNSTVNTLNDTVETQNKTITEQKANIEQLNNTINTQEKTINELADKLNNTAKDLEAANKKVEDLNKTNNELANNLSKANNDINNLTNANKELNNNLIAANKKVDDLAKANDDLAKQLNDTNKKVDEIVKSVDNLITQLNNTQEKVNNLTKEVADKEKTIQELTTKKATKVTVDKVNTTNIGNNVIITGKVTDTTGTAINNMPVSIKINSASTKVVTNTNGVYKYTTTAKTVGTSNVTVSTIANDKYTTSNAKTTFTVNKANPTLKLNTITSVKFKDKVTITGSLMDNTNKAISSASITLKINTKSVTVKTAKDGSFTYTTTATSMGTNNITATYAGNTNYNKATKKTTFKVNKQNLILTVDRVASGLKYKDPLVVGGRLVDGNNKAVANTLVSLQFNGKTYKAKTDKNGYYKITTRATTMGTNTLIATYADNTKYNKASAKTTFTVAKQDIIITFDKVSYNNGKVTISGTFTDRNRHALMNSLARITLNGKQGTAKTDKTGTFTYTTTAKQGTYKVTLAYPGNDRYNAYSKTSTVKTA